MSQLVIRESSESDQTSESQELSDQMHEQISKMVHSESHVDKRLIKFFRVRQASQKMKDFNALRENNRKQIKESVPE